MPLKIGIKNPIPYWGGSPSSGGNRNKSSILLYIGGQSNSGTDPNTGRVAYADMPSYLKQTYTNVYFYDIALDGTGVFATYDATAGNQMGWIDQVVYALSFVYENVYVVKRAVGGTKLAPPTNDVDSYPRTDFKTRANAAKAIMDGLYGADGYDKVMLWNQGETDGLDAADAAIYETSLSDWIDEVRTDVDDTVWIFNRLGDLQVDVTYLTDIRTAQENVAALSSRNKMVNADGLRQKTTDRIHFSYSGAISLGDYFTDKILQTVGRSRFDKIAPTIVSAVVGNATPMVLTLTYDKTLNSGVLPFWAQWQISNGSVTKTITTVVISGTTVSLTVTVPFYTGETWTISYTKNDFFRENLQDKQGRQVNNLTDYSITNNVLTAAPTVTAVYTANWSAGTDSWIDINGGTVSAPETIGGFGNCIKNVPDLSSVMQRTTSPMLNLNTYRYRFWIYVPITTYNPPVGNNFTLVLDQIIPTLSILSLAPTTYLSWLLYYDTWQYFEVQFTRSTVNDDMRFINTMGVAGAGAYYVRDFVLERIT